MCPSNGPNICPSKASLVCPLNGPIVGPLKAPFMCPLNVPLECFFEWTFGMLLRMDLIVCQSVENCMLKGLEVESKLA